MFNIFQLCCVYGGNITFSAVSISIASGRSIQLENLTAVIYYSAVSVYIIVI